MLSINQLMKYLRNHHQIAVKSNQAQALRNIGYGFLKNGIPVDVVARSIPELSYKEVEDLQKRYFK